MGDYTYVRVTEDDGTVHYYEFWSNHDGVWFDGRVDYTVQSRELSYEEWLLCSIIYG